MPYPEKMDTKICVKLKDGKEHCIKKEDYKGFYTRPLSWDDVTAKFHSLGESSMEADAPNEIIRIVRNLEHEDVGSLVNALAGTPIPV